MAEMMRNQASDKEKADGSRDNVNLGEQAGKPDRANGAENPMERGSGQPSEPAKPLGAPKSHEGNRDDAGTDFRTLGLQKTTSSAPLIPM